MSQVSHIILCGVVVSGECRWSDRAKKLLALWLCKYEFRPLDEVVEATESTYVCRVSPAGFRRDYDRYHAQILKYVFADVNGEACCVALPFSLNVNSRLNIRLVNRRVTYPRRHCLLAAGPNSFIQFINLFIRRDQIVASLLNWT